MRGVLLPAVVAAAAWYIRRRGWGDKATDYLVLADGLLSALIMQHPAWTVAQLFEELVKALRDKLGLSQVTAERIAAQALRAVAPPPGDLQLAVQSWIAQNRGLR